MNWRNNSNRYGSLAIALHWAMLLLLIAVYATIELRELFPKGSDPRTLMKTWHFMLGLSVLVLALLRLINRLSAEVPTMEPAPSHGQQWLARVMHIALYFLILAMPLLGWLLLSAAGKPIPFFGLELPPLIEADEATADFVKELHEVLGTAGYVLIALHGAAALYHHYVVRDNTLQQMLPERK